MKTSLTHKQQHQIWEEEHQNPSVLLPMDSENPSSGVVMFWEWYKKRKAGLQGLEMGSGKGRNSIWLAKQGANMSAFDFSEIAVAEAKTRAKREGVENVSFSASDATELWPYGSEAFDFAIDCFASTDIETQKGRMFATREFLRVLKPGGYLLVYTLSTDDEFHKYMLIESPGPEQNSFLHPSSGKFEKVFDREELLELYKDFKIIEEKRVEKKATFFEKEYDCKHFWIIFQKSI